MFHGLEKSLAPSLSVTVSILSLSFKKDVLNNKTESSWPLYSTDAQNKALIKKS